MKIELRLTGTIMEILKEYELLLSEIDNWFAHCQTDFHEDIACGKGCSDCCVGLFDITVLIKRVLDIIPSGIYELAKSI